MLKKVTLGSAILMSTLNLAHADETPYIGGGLGFGAIGYSQNRKLYVNSPALKLFGGYGSHYGKDGDMYLGKELNIDVVHNGTNTYGVGASLLPGYYFTKSTMVYGRLGVEATHNSYSSHITSQLGAGVQTSLTKKVDMRFEYTALGASGYGGPAGQLGLGLTYKFL